MKFQTSVSVIYSFLTAFRQKSGGYVKNATKWFSATVPVLCFAILLLTLRGYTGNPTASQLNTKEWEDNGPFELSPERGRFALTYSVVEDKSLFYSLPVARFALPDLGYKNGKYVSLFAPGVSYIIMPGYMIGKMLGASQLGAYAVISLFAMANVLLIMKITSALKIHSMAGAIAGMAFLFATPAFNYAVTLYQHHISTFLILSSLYILLTKTGFYWNVIFWLLFAASVPVDYPNLFLMLPMAIFAGLRIFVTERTDEHLKITLRIPIFVSMIGMILPLLFFFWFNNASYGNPMQFSGTVTSVKNIDADGNPVKIQVKPATKEQSIRKLSEQKRSAVNFFQTREITNGLYTHLFSPDRGIVRFAPIIFLALFGAYFVYQKNKWLTVLMIGVMAADLTLYSLWGDPWGGWAFGSRYMIPFYAVASLFLAALLDRFRSSYLFLLILIVLLGYSIFVNTAGALTSSANPPKSEVLYLEEISGVQQRYSYDRNLYALNQGTSKSAAFITYFSQYTDAYTYFVIISSLIFSIFLIYIFLLHFVL